MRILVISNLYPPAVRGGYEVECAGVVNHLRERGDKVAVLTSKLGRGEAEDEGVLRLLSLLPQSPLGALRAPLASLAATRATRNVIASFRPDLIFAWNCAQIPHAAVYAALESGLPVTFRVCEHWFGRLFSGDQFARYLFPGDRGLRRAWAALVRATNRSPALRLDLDSRVPVAVSWVSQYLRDSMAAIIGVKIVLEQVTPSIPPNAVQLASMARKPGDGRMLICYVGRLSAEKGPDVAIRALAHLRHEHALEAELVLAGFGSRRERRELIDLSKSLGVGEFCSFKGQLEQEAVADLLSRGHVLLFPSIWQEPLGLVAIEGALARVPVVASRVGGVPELLADREQILLFPPGDAIACAEAIARVLTHPTETTEQVQRAFERASSLSWKSYLRAIDTFIAESLAALAR